MTFLEYVIENLLGPPIRTGNPGESFWHCPICDSARFHSLPRKDPFPDKFKCFKCDFWGDSHDMLLQVSPRKYGTRAKRDRVLGKWKKEYSTIMKANTSKPNHLTSRGRGNTTQPFGNEKFKNYGPEDAELDEFGEAADRAVEELKASTKASRLALKGRFEFAAKALALCLDLEIHPLAMMGRLKGEVVFIEMESRHLARCTDGDCDADICRKARGRKPLTQKQREKLIQEHCEKLRKVVR